MNHSVVYILPKRNDLSGEDLKRIFPAEFADKILSTANEELRRMRINTYLLLGYALFTGGIKFPYFIEKDAAGKPFLRGVSDVKFSLSHTNGMSAVALSGYDCGVDAEDTGRDALFCDIAKSFFHPDEYVDLKSGGDVRMKFFRYWTAKESLFKLTGSGMKRELSRKKIFDEITLMKMRYERWTVGGFLVAALTKDGANLVTVNERDLKDFLTALSSSR